MKKIIKLGTLPALLTLAGLTGGGVIHSQADVTPKPEGNVIARGEAAVPWELYENGYLLFKPEPGKDMLTNPKNGDTPWKRQYGEKIKHVGFSGKVYAPSNGVHLFSRYGNNDDLKFNPLTLDVSNLDTSKMFTTYGMFYGLTNLTTLDVSHFDTSHVIYMRDMFKYMSNLTTLDVTHFDTSKVTNMSHMFDGVSKLTNLDVRNFNTSNVTDMSAMFQDMSELTHLDVTHFDTRNVTDMGGMFSGTSKLTSLDVTHFDTSKVTNMHGMFRMMSSLSTLDVTHLDTSNVTDMGWMFYGMSNLTTLDVTNFDTTKVTNMSTMFAETPKLKELKLGDKFKADGIETIDKDKSRNAIQHAYGNQYTDKWHKINDKEHPYTVEDWANLYKANPTGTAGTWVREEVPQEATLTFEGENFPPVKVQAPTTTLPDLPRPHDPNPNKKFKGWSRTPGGAPIDPTSIKPGENITLHPIWEDVNNTKTRTEKIPVTTIYEADPNLDYGKQTETPGVEGEKRITTTYTVTPYTGELTNPQDKEEIITQMKPKVIKKGTKPKTTSTSIDSPVEYVIDKTRDVGTKNEEIPGKKGSTSITTTYTVDPQTGNVTETQGQPVRVEPTKTIIKVGGRDKVTTTPIKSPIEYVLDKNKPRTSPQETKPGNEGSIVTTITHTVDPNTGKVTENPPTTQTTPPTKTIITVGGRDDEETEVIPPEIEYVPDDTNPGETIQGKPGKKVTPITYTIDPNTGTVTPHKGAPIITPPTKTIIKVSTKPKVVTEDIEPGTRYEADPSRDKGTPNVTIPGKKGKKVTTTTYTLDKATGKTIEHTDKPVIIPPVDTIIKVGTKTKVITEIIEPGIEYVRDDNNTGEKIQGKPGKKVITITYTVDPNTGNVTENTGKPEITPPINTIVKIGTRDDVINEPIEPGVIYEGDATRDANTPNVTIPGKQGKKTTLITYELEPGTGKRIEKRGTPRVTPPINTIVKVGTKPKVVTKVIEPEVIYEGDDTRDSNTPNVTIPGKKGFTSTTTTYTVDPKTGKLTEKTTEKNEAPGKTIVKVGSKPKVVTELIDPEVLYEGDDTQDVNSPNVTIPGTKGTKTTTTTYTVDPKTGKVTEKTTESGTKPGTTRIKVGTKPTVKRVTDPNGDVYEETTTYTVDPKTGKVTLHTTRKLISKAAPKDPNDGAKAGNGIDENGNPIKPPVLEVSEYTGVIAGNGLDGEGNIIEPPVLEVPEYKGVIAGNGLDGEGNIIEPPVLEVPEYKGDLNNKPKEEPKVESKSTPKEQPKKKLPETGDSNPAYLASLAVLGIVLLRRKRQK